MIGGCARCVSGRHWSRRRRRRLERAKSVEQAARRHNFVNIVLGGFIGVRSGIRAGKRDDPLGTGLSLVQHLGCPGARLGDRRFGGALRRSEESPDLCLAPVHRPRALHPGRDTTELVGNRVEDAGNMMNGGDDTRGGRAVIGLRGDQRASVSGCVLSGPGAAIVRKGAK